MNQQAKDSSLHSDKRYLVKGTILNLVGLVLRNISPVLMIGLARLFPSEVFGVFISVQLFVLTFSHLLMMGFDRGMIWYIPHNQKAGRPLHSGLVPVTYITHITAFIVWLLVAVFYSIHGEHVISSLRPVSPFFILLCLFSLVPFASLHGFAAVLEGLRLPEYKLLVNQFLTITLGPLIAIVLHIVGVGSISLAIGFTASNLLGAIVILWIVNRRLPGIRWNRLERIRRDLWRYSWPLGLAEAVAGILLRVDLWMILLLLGPKDAAVYAIMLTLSNGLKTIQQNYDPLIVPIVSTMKAEDRKAHLKHVYSYAVNMVTSIQMLVAVAVLFFPVEIMSIAGKSYSVQPQALSILLVGNLVHGFLGLNGQVILGLGKSRFMLGLNASTLVLNLILNIVLIPRMGISGAATATVLAYIVQCLVMFIHQTQLTGRYVYEAHLTINALLILSFSVATFGFQELIIQLPLLDKITGYLTSMMVLVLLFAIKRNSFSLAER
jgi:O-antigen/teichoic acid export membrane protein